VFLPGEYDFYRTRLTHSIEVSQIGRAICNFLLKKKGTLLNENYFIDPDLVECACLAHDLGHPPFGHAGERTLNSLMKKYGGFEGNAQTLRLITEIFYKEQTRRRGMNPTRAFLDSILKYKAIYSQFDSPENHFIYDYQKERVDFVFGSSNIPAHLTKPEVLNDFRSIECQIMDWADDTAYAINDIVDSIETGFLNIASLANWTEEQETNLTSTQKKSLFDIMEWMKSGTYKAKFGSQIGSFIVGCDLREDETFLDNHTNRYRYKLLVNEENLEKTEIYKKISIELVFNSSHLHQMEFKGNSMLSEVFRALVVNYTKTDNPVKLLPDLSHKLIREEEDNQKKVRLICDQIAGMTDSFAIKTYRRLFDPGFSSILELS